MTEIWGLPAGLLVCAIALGWLIPRAAPLGLVDQPGGRKDHGAPIPVVGGLAMWLGLAAGAVSAGLLPVLGAPLLAGAALVVLGIVDDRRDLDWRIRILTQIAAATLLVYAGDALLTRLGEGNRSLSLQLGWFGWPFSVFAIVGLVNALNMIDGVDGLAGSLSLTSLLTMLVLSVHGDADHLSLPLALIGGIVAVFLAANLRLPGRPRALTFMGNSGSALLGMLLAWAAVRLTADGDSTITPALGPWLVALPILDCLGLIALRLIDGRSPFSADRGHLHHLLLDRGWSVGALVLTAVSAQLGLAALGLVLHKLGVSDVALIGLFLLLVLGHVGLLLLLKARNGRSARLTAAALLLDEGGPRFGP